MPVLPHAQLRPASLNEIRPGGWLQTFLEKQASGLTGHAAVSGYPYGYKLWGSLDDHTKGAYSAWWPFEQTAYWIDGALKCGYLAEDKGLYRQALEEIDFAVEHASADGFIGPDSMREKDRWPYTVFFRAVLAQYEISGDPRYLQALARHYRAMPHPLSWDRDVTGVEILLQLYQETGQADLLVMAEQLYAGFNQKWPKRDCTTANLLSEIRPTEHGVTYNEEAKLGAMLYCADGNPEHLQAAVHGFMKLEREARLADGQHSCSEPIRGREPLDSHETCDITDHTWSLAHLLAATGEAHYADQIERVIFNALPGAITKDFHALQYFSCPNQVVAGRNTNHNFMMRGLNWMSYRPDHEVQCCPGNVHRAMPNFVSRMWLRTREGGVVAALYGPGRLRTTVGPAEAPVTITARTRYPYEEMIEFAIQPEQPARFAFLVRIPGWCRQAGLSVNGQPVAAQLKPGSFYSVERTWQPGDVVRLEVPFELAMEHWPGGGVSLTYGPLTLALPVPAHAEKEQVNSTVLQQQAALGAHYEPRPRVDLPDFPAWELTPAGPWNYALCLDEDSLNGLQVEWNPDFTDPLDAANPPLKLRVKARRVRGWRLVHTHKTRHWCHWDDNGQFRRGIRTISGDFTFTPPLPDPKRLAGKLGKEEEIELIPYGATLLRITVFPQA
jgi:uncharacterized protein